MVLSQPALGVRRIAVIRNEQRPRNDAVRIKPHWTAPGGVWGTEDILVVPHRFAGGFGPADPALDLVAAWHLLDAGPRDLLRSTLGDGELIWRRGAAWAFEQAMGAAWYCASSHP